MLVSSLTRLDVSISVRTCASQQGVSDVKGNARLTGDDTGLIRC